MRVGGGSSSLPDVWKEIRPLGLIGPERVGKGLNGRLLKVSISGLFVRCITSCPTEQGWVWFFPFAGCLKGSLGAFR